MRATVGATTAERLAEWADVTAVARRVARLHGRTDDPAAPGTAAAVPVRE